MTPMTPREYLAHFDTAYREKLTEHPVFADRYNGFRRMFESLLAQKAGGFTIVETGTLRRAGNWFDGQSSLLFFEFLSFFGGTLVSIDADKRALETCESVLRDTVGLGRAEHVSICGDSVAELENIDRPVDLLYLDSLDFNEANPLPAMMHPLKEFASAARIRAQSPHLIVAVDDNFGDGAGKGALLKVWARDTGKEVIHDGLQFIFGV